MRWKRGHKSRDLEDRRADGPARRTGLAVGAGGSIVAIVLVLLLGPDALKYMGEGGSSGGASNSSTQQQGQSQGQGQKPVSNPAEDELADFVGFVLDDVQDHWEKRFPTYYNQRYKRAKLRLFRGSTSSACGLQGAAVGPFYCPADQKAYVDLSFYQELKRRFAAPGDFAQAYVIAHEIGHHVQNLVGTSDQVHRAQRGAGKRKSNDLSIRLELQADCLSGVWAHHTKNQGTLERGDIEEGLRAAAAIGDDNIQKQSTGTVSPESWTHGSSEQRVRWFMAGFNAGNIQACDTFSASRL